MDHDMPPSSSSHMSMTFTTSIHTPLFTTPWTPSTPSLYALTCLFLLLLALLARFLIALKAHHERRCSDRDARRRYIAVPSSSSSSPDDSSNLADRIISNYNDNDNDDNYEGKQILALSENGVEERVFVVERMGRGQVMPWRMSVDPVRAVLDTVIVGVGYLLMLAVMTMNVGYFLSVLAGVFIGSLAFGRYSTGFTGH